jgi:GGDEF domain-containing protein
MGIYESVSPTPLEVATIQLFLVMTCLTTYAAGIVSDSKREAIETLYRLATTDELTGLPNRNGALSRLREALADDHSQARQTAILIIDLVGFSSLNTTLGHTAGDAALRKCA